MIVITVTMLDAIQVCDCDMMLCELYELMDLVIIIFENVVTTRNLLFSDKFLVTQLIFVSK